MQKMSLLPGTFAAGNVFDARDSAGGIVPSQRCQPKTTHELCVESLRAILNKTVLTYMPARTPRRHYHVQRCDMYIKIRSWPTSRMPWKLVQRERENYLVFRYCHLLERSKFHNSESILQLTNNSQVGEKNIFWKGHVIG